MVRRSVAPTQGKRGLSLCVWKSLPHVSGIMEAKLMGMGYESDGACSGPFLNLKGSWG